LKKFRDCANINLGEEIEIIDSNYLVCEPYSPPMLYSIFSISKGSKIKVLKKPMIIRQGKRVYRCVYIHNKPDFQTEDDYVSPGKKVREIGHKTKFFVSESEVVRLKLYQMLFLQREKHYEISMIKALGLSN